MRIRTWTVILPLVVLGAVSATTALAAETNLLIGVTGDFGPQAGDDPLLIRSRYVVVNTALQNNLKTGQIEPESVIGLSLFDDFEPLLVLERGRPTVVANVDAPQGVPPSPSGYHWRGTLKAEQGSAILTVFGTGLGGRVYTNNGTMLTISQVSEVLHIVREFQVVQESSCGTEPDPPLAEDAPPDQQFAGLMGMESGCECDDGSIIDLLVVYTEAARDEAEACTTCPSCDTDKIICHIRDAVAAANQAFKNSQITIGQVTPEVRLVGAVMVSGFPAATVCDALDALADPWDGNLDEIHALRSHLNADLVSLIIKTLPGCGVACAQPCPCAGSYVDQNNQTQLCCICSNFVGRAKLLGEPSPREMTAFSTVWQSYIQSGDNLTLAHELGHNFGCAHDRVQEQCVINCNCTNQRACKASFGHKFSALGTNWRTIMSYQAPGTTEVRIQYFSNPNVNFLNEPTGIAYCDPPYDCDATEPPANCPPCDFADNANTITTTLPIIATYRRSCDTTNTTTIASYDHWLPLAGNNDSEQPCISNDGKLIAFQSEATSFAETTGNDNGVADIFLFNRNSGRVDLISRKYNANPSARPQSGDGESRSAAISGDGHWIVFESDASDLIPNGSSSYDNNSLTDIYAVDSSLRANTKRISVGIASGGNPDGASKAPSISGDGDRVVFESDATNLMLTSDGNGVTDIYLRDFSGIQPANRRISVDTSSGDPNGASNAPAISGNGLHVAFESVASDLVNSDPNGSVRDIFVRDMSGTPKTILVTNVSGGTNGDSYAPSISETGRFVAFVSAASNIVAGDSNGVWDVFLHDRDTDFNGVFDEAGNTSTIRISESSSGGEANGRSYSPRISARGEYVVFTSEATNLDTVSNIQLPAIYVHNIVTGTTNVISVNSDGDPASDDSLWAAISDDGRFIAFDSDGTNLDANDNNGARDVFIRDRGRMLPGDLNGDFNIDHRDFLLLLQQWGPCPCCAGDLDGDGDVDEDDYTLMGGE